jgi:hypothetical protein
VIADKPPDLITAGREIKRDIERRELAQHLVEFVEVDHELVVAV